MWRISPFRLLLHSKKLGGCGRASVFDRSSSGDTKDNESRYNELGIQLLSPSLHSQLFKDSFSDSLPSDKSSIIEKHLKQHGLWGKPTTSVQDVSFELPKLKGANLDEHFRAVAEEVNGPYVKLAESLQACTLPKRPKVWTYEAGWTRYDPTTGKGTPIEYPACDVLVFDVEVLVPEGNFPTMAVAVSPNYWYSWCSHRVMDRRHFKKTELGIEDLINLEKLDTLGKDFKEERQSLIIGHNVGFDRSFVKEQYYINKKCTKFLDTMSMHIAVAGLTNIQRILYNVGKRDDKGMGRKEVREHYKHERMAHNLSWTAESSLNNLHDVHKLYCPHEPRLKKETRETFVKGKMVDVREHFQELMNYCASDVQATHSVFKNLWLDFRKRFPHPVTLAGMLEMGTAYLPINKNWEKYKMAANNKCDMYEREMQEVLMKLADDTLEYAKDEKFRKDLWLWDLDWTTKKFRINLDYHPDENPLLRKDIHISTVKYPAWYAELCPRLSEYSAKFMPGRPSKISTKRRATPKLLRLTWKGFPLHHHEDYKWGYLVPDPEQPMAKFAEWDRSDTLEPYCYFPRDEFFEYIETHLDKEESEIELSNIQLLERKMESLAQELDRCVDEATSIQLMRELKEAEKFVRKAKQDEKKKKDVPPENGLIDIGVPGVKFMRMPHKNGPNNAVGNPLAKDFIPRIDDGSLKCCSTMDLNDVLKHSNIITYWHSAKKRILGQMNVVFEPDDIPLNITSDEKFDKKLAFGAIIPRLITAGTVTRRAVEPTWLTASNAYPDRVGSELKAIVQSPPGYCFVGADVDSQELWIAAIIGDAHFGGIHGCTAFGWMTLQGNKKDGTDLHSKTASLVGITRDQAKIFNYGRIYGAGEKFARQLLKQFNNDLSEEEVVQKARSMYAATKGKQKRTWKYKFKEEDEEDETPMNEVIEKWQGGSESAMFNKLESIACSEQPCTPALEARISKVLEPHNVSGDFITSRINWVVQSSGVDYLHLMLVSMRWLFQEFGIEGRFSISIHDEVRYLVKKEDRYRAALALQITNLYTRSLFAYKLGMNDLPESVAFFSAVDIDTCLRKEVYMDCVTPSNPDGIQKGYGIEPGTALSIYEILEKTGGRLDIREVTEESVTNAQVNSIIEKDLAVEMK